jgi:heme oxygenase
VIRIKLILKYLTGELLMSLRDLTKDKHTDAERTAFAKTLLSGNITKEQYAFYLTQMMAVYAVLEHQAAIHNLFDDLHGLARCRAIYDDLNEIVNGVNYAILPATRAYVEYLEQLDDANKIMAHLYVRHMGDLFGGQIIAKRVPGSGKFYQFNNEESLKAAIRAKLDDSMGDEANVAFDHAIAIMKELNESSMEQVDPNSAILRAEV